MRYDGDWWRGKSMKRAIGGEPDPGLLENQTSMTIGIVY